MRKIVLSFSLLAALTISATPLSKPVSPPTTSFYEIREIIDLYRDGQYDIVKAKLANQGFTVTATEPDYSLHGIKHEGSFKMEYSTDSPSALNQQYGIKSTSYYHFSTLKHGETVHSEISIELPSYESKYIYNAFNNGYNQGYNAQKLEQDTNCSTGVSCIHFWGQTGQMSNFKDFIQGRLNVNSYAFKETSGNTTDYLVFSADLTFEHVMQEAKAVAPTKKIAAPIKRKK